MNRYKLTYLSGLLMVAVAMFCWSCQEDELDLSVPLSLSVIQADQVEVQTRAITATGFSAFPASGETTDYEIGIYCPPTRYSTKSTFSYSNGSWVTENARIDAGKTYQIFGFMPVAAVDASSMLNVGSSAQAGTKPTLHLTGVKAFPEHDICVVVGAGFAGTQTLSADTPQLGKFDFTGQSDERLNKIFLMMQRITSQIEFLFAVGNNTVASTDIRYDEMNYAGIRTIKLKKVELSVGGYSQSLDIDIAMNPNDESKDPIYSIMSSASADASAKTTLMEKSDAEALTLATNGWTSAGSIPVIALNNSPVFTMKVTYDVYHAKTGALIRKDCTAQNKWTMTKFGRGNKYQVEVVVKPTYLYQLSDDDINNPGIVIN